MFIVDINFWVPSVLTTSVGPGAHLGRPTINYNLAPLFTTMPSQQRVNESTKIKPTYNGSVTKIQLSNLVANH